MAGSDSFFRDYLPEKAHRTLPRSSLGRVLFAQLSCQVNNRPSFHPNTKPQGLSHRTRRSSVCLDTKLSIECGFYQAEDGVTRCLPILKGFQIDSAKYYLDSACTQLVFALQKCSPKPEYASEDVPGPMPCGRFPFRVYKLSSAVTATTLYKKEFFGSCNPVDAGKLSTLVSAVNFYPLTAIAPTEFVKGDWKYVQTP